ncbi:MAG TPA: alpha/beta fold hydrolase [Dehalococcoidia bacterium]|nr:alpha/beta fold hydrolase [Dehalococcoidia bacterium]
MTTRDGINLAYAVAGEGQQVVNLPWHFNDLLGRWSGPPIFRGMAEHYRVLHYDGRGQGLSTRGMTRDLTTADLHLDLDTVLKASGFDRFAFVAYGGLGHVALRYAVEHPERVTALVLICSSESFDAWSQSAHLGIAEENWDLFLELQTRKFPPEVRPLVINWLKPMTSQSDYLHLVRAFIADPSVSHLLPRVTMPTLLLHSLDQHWLPPAEGANVAAKIRGARIVFTDGDVEPDTDQALRAILDFLKGVPVSAAIGPQPSHLASEIALSSRQLEVLRLIAEGKRTQEIAGALVLSERTVERHIAGVYAKIGARNRSEATAYALSRPDVLEPGAKYPLPTR